MYTVYVKSNNLRGNSVASTSTSIAPFSVPFSPTIYKLKPSDSTITVYFTEPANGGNTITDYLYSVLSFDGGPSPDNPPSPSFSASLTPHSRLVVGPSLYSVVCGICIVSTFVLTLLLYYYGYIREIFSFDPNPDVSEKWHCMIHWIASLGHHCILLL